MLALRVPRVDAATVLAEARALAVELGALPLLETVETLARMARLDLPSDARPARSSTPERTRSA